MSKIKKIYFIEAEYNGWKSGCNFLRAYQPCFKLRELGRESEVINMCRNRKIYDIKDSIFIFLNFYVHFGNFINFGLNMDKIKENNNILVSDFCFGEEVSLCDKSLFYKNFSLFDAFIVPNQVTYDFIFTILIENEKKRFSIVEKNGSYCFGGRIIKIIPHHFDVRFSLNEREFNEAKICFLGNSFNLVYNINKELEYISVLDDCFFDKYDKYNTHFAVVNKKHQKNNYLYKSNMKLANACGAGANIILSKNPSHTELLDLSYPYYIEDESQKGVDRMIQYVKDSYGSEVWFSGLEQIMDLREKLTLDSVIKYYIDFFKDLS